MSQSSNLRPLNHVNLALLAAALLCFTFAGVALVAAPDPKDPKATDIELAWQRNWKNYARRCIKLGGDYFTLSTYETQFPSSKGITTTALRQKTSKEVVDRFGSNAKMRKILVRPNEEIELLAKSLPEPTIGHYGSIHSAEVLAILGPDEMVIGNIWLVSGDALAADREKEKLKLEKAGVEKGDIKEVLDWMFEPREEILEKQRDRSFRRSMLLRGFSTVGLAKGERWSGKATDKSGPQIAFVGEQDVMPPTGKSKKPVTLTLAVPAELFARPIAEEKEFVALLTAREFTKELFVTLMQDERKVNGTDDRLADAHIFAKLDGRTEEKPGDKPAVKPKEKKPGF